MSYDDYQSKLDHIMSRVELEGATPELEAELNALFEKASVVVLLGPNDTFERTPIEINRERADQFDIDYYKDTFANVDYPAFFKSDLWGNATVTYEEQRFEGNVAPGCRISWQNKIDFVREAYTEDGKKTIEAYLSYFAMVLGCRWYRWMIEVA